MKNKDRASMPGALALADTLNRLGPPCLGGFKGMQGMTATEIAENQKMRLPMATLCRDAANVDQQRRDLEREQMKEAMRLARVYPALADPDHNNCHECGRLFINNISCPRCGWRMPR